VQYGAVAVAAWADGRWWLTHPALLPSFPSGRRMFGMLMGTLQQFQRSSQSDKEKVR
jgi:hypothetical protein